MSRISNYMANIQALLTPMAWHRIMLSITPNYEIIEMIWPIPSFFRFVNQDPEKQSAVLKFIQLESAELSVEPRPFP